MGKGIEKCPVAKQCGGCRHIDRPYEEQLRAKDARVMELFGALRESAGGNASVGPSGSPSGSPCIRPIIGMDDPCRYRNKVISPFAPGKRRADGRREILTGMYAAGTHRLVNTDGCLVENERANQVVRAVRQLMGKHHIEPYDEDRHAGFMRHVVVRVGHESGEVLVTLVTNGAEFPASKSFCRALVKCCPYITSIVQNVNTRRTNVVMGSDERRLYGPGFILDTLCGLSFRISSQSFYQVNSQQTAVLYETAVSFALDGVTGAPALRPDVIIDAYCGTGTIGLVAAQRSSAQVIGVDSVEAAIRDARQNARHNGVGNARFVVADAAELMQRMARDGKRADVVLMDPPRAGSTPEFLNALAALAPARVVYVSCNPETQVRDVRYLARLGYALDVVQPLDMFPHTDHIECVALMSRIEGALGSARVG